MSKELAEKKDLLETLAKMRDLKVSGKIQVNKKLGELIKQAYPEAPETGKLLQ